MVAEMVTTPPTISPGVGVVLVIVGPVVSMMKVRKTSEVAVPLLSLTSSSHLRHDLLVVRDRRLARYLHRGPRWSGSAQPVH